MSTKDNEIDLGRGLSIKYYKITNNNPSPYNLTSIWTNAKYFLKFIKVDNFGRAETKIPGRGKLEEFEK